MRVVVDLQVQLSVSHVIYLIIIIVQSQIHVRYGPSMM